MKGAWFGLAVTLTLGVADAASAADLSGTWNVISTVADDGCGGATNSVTQWLLAQNGTDIEVTVLGKTSFPELRGKRTPGGLKLEGVSKDASSRYKLHTGYLVPGLLQLHMSLVLDLKPEADAYVGTSHALSWVSFGKDGLRPCLITRTIKATKQ